MRTQRSRILVVDDEQFVRELLQDFFTKMDYKVVAASDGVNGVSACQSGKFDAALVDLKMPRMGGIEVLAEFAEIDPVLPVIMMTGYPTIDSSIEALRKGAYDYIIKPFKLQELKELVDRAVKEQTVSREIEDLRERLGNVEMELRQYREAASLEPVDSPTPSPLSQETWKSIPNRR